MNHPERINAEHHTSTRWRLPPMGWFAVYTLAAFFFGILFYIARRPL